MQHLEDKARADGITVPLTGNNNGTFNSGTGALDVDGPDSYPQGFNCSNPSAWNGVPDISYDHPAGKPLYTPEFQGGAFDPWGGPGYDKCAQLINDQFADVFYKNNIAVGATAQSFYMTYGGTNWGWLGEPENYTSYDYGAAIRETRQLDPKYYEDKLIGDCTRLDAGPDQDRPASRPPRRTTPRSSTPRGATPTPARSSTCCGTADSTSTAVDNTHIAIDFNALPGRQLHLRRRRSGPAVHRRLVARRQPELHRQRLQEHRIVLQHRRRLADRSRSPAPRSGGSARRPTTTATPTSTSTASSRPPSTAPAARARPCSTRPLV